MTGGASLRSRVKGNFQARFWSSGGWGDSPTDCRGMWNCRVFREGKRKGRSPYDLLGWKLPTSDWWQLLQMDPEELGQKIVNSIS